MKIFKMTAIAFVFSIHAVTAVLAATLEDSAPETVRSSEADRLYYLNRWAQAEGDSEEMNTEKMLIAIQQDGVTYDAVLATQRPRTYAELKMFLASIDWPNMSEYERLEACFNRIATGHNGNVYGNTGGHDLYEYDVLVYKQGICADYATELTELCKYVGLTAEYCLRTVDPTPLGMHGITKVLIDGVWYGVDPTWSQGESLSEDMYVYDSDEFLKIYGPQRAELEYMEKYPERARFLYNVLFEQHEEKGRDSVLYQTVISKDPERFHHIYPDVDI